MWNDWQNLVATMFQHVMYSLPCKELVGMLSFTESIEEQRQIVMIIKLVNFHLTAQSYDTGT